MANTLKAKIQSLKVENMKASRLARSKGEDVTDANARVEAYNEVLDAITKTEIANVTVNKNDTDTGSSRVELTDEQVLKVIKTVKKSNEKVIEKYIEKGVDQSSIDAIKVRVNILAELLPEELTEEEIRVAVNVLVDNGANTVPEVMKALKGTEGVNMGVASKIARELLS